jgi:hypothetical protein
MANKFIRGALVEFVPTFGIPLPNVIIFQFNPETMTHAWTAAEAMSSPTSEAKANPLATTGNPGESFTLSIFMDAAEPVADSEPVAGALATVSGVYTRIAALELLLFPVPSDKAGGLVGSVSASVGAGGISIGGAGGGEAERAVPDSVVPTVLFVWGPGRILPVRVTSLSITERLYDALLNPTHAEANLTLRVLTPEELAWVRGPLGDVARAGYDYSLALRRGLAAANLGNAVDSVIGMLPV